MTKKSQELASEELVTDLLLEVYNRYASFDHPAYRILDDPKLRTWVTSILVHKFARDVKKYIKMAYKRRTNSGFKLLCQVCPFVTHCIEANSYEKHETIKIVMCNSCSNFIVTGDKEITWRYFSNGEWPFDQCPYLYKKYDKTIVSCEHHEKYPKYRDIDDYMETCGLHQIVPKQPMLLDPPVPGQPKQPKQPKQPILFDPPAPKRRPGRPKSNPSNPKKIVLGMLDYPTVPPPKQGWDDGEFGNI